MRFSEFAAVVTLRRINQIRLGVERAITHAKTLASWDSEKHRAKHGKTYEVQKLCAKCGVRVSKGSIMHLAGEVKAQEGHAEKVFQEAGEVTGMDFSPSRRGSGCGAPDKLTEEVKEAYREIVRRSTRSRLTLGRFAPTAPAAQRLRQACSERSKSTRGTNLVVPGPATSVTFAVP